MPKKLSPKNDNIYKKKFTVKKYKNNYSKNLQQKLMYSKNDFKSIALRLSLSKRKKNICERKFLRGSKHKLRKIVMVLKKRKPLM